MSQTRKLLRVQHNRIQRVDLPFSNNPLYCPFCGISTGFDSGGHITECSHLLFAATSDGFTYRSELFNKIAGLTDNITNVTKEQSIFNKIAHLPSSTASDFNDHPDTFTDNLFMDYSVKFVMYDRYIGYVANPEDYTDND